jgi:hypothetical protein
MTCLHDGSDRPPLHLLLRRRPAAYFVLDGSATFPTPIRCSVVTARSNQQHRRPRAAPIRSLPVGHSAPARATSGLSPMCYGKTMPPNSVYLPGLDLIPSLYIIPSISLVCISHHLCTCVWLMLMDPIDFRLHCTTHRQQSFACQTEAAGDNHLHAYTQNKLI